MARRKTKTKRRRSYRRGRISGIANFGDGALLKIAGAVAGKMLSDVVAKQLPESGFKKWAVAATPVAGYFITKMVSKNAMAKQLADGMLIIGGYQVARETGVVSGIMNDYDRRFVALGPTFQNPRGVVAGTMKDGMSSARAAAMLS